MNGAHRRVDPRAELVKPRDPERITVEEQQRRWVSGILRGLERGGR